MAICIGCNGVMGRDCFNSQECQKKANNLFGDEEIKLLRKQLTATQQALDSAVEALKDVRDYALANEADIARSQSAAQMITMLKAITQNAIKETALASIKGWL